MRSPLKISSLTRRELYRLGQRYATTQSYCLSPPIQHDVDLSADTDCFLGVSTSRIKHDVDDDAIISVMSPDVASLAAGIDHYLLLARTSRKMKVESHQDSNNNTYVIDNDDGSSCRASFTSPAPLLQAVSEYNSPNDEEREQQQGMLNLLSSFNMEELQNYHHTDGLSTESFAWNKKHVFLVLNILALVTVLAMLVLWCRILDWRNTALGSIMHNAGVNVIQWKLTTKHRWSYVKHVYTSWRDDFDLLSCLIRLIYRLQIMHQATSYCIVEMQHKLWTIHDSFVVAWNITLSVVVSHSQYFMRVVSVGNTSYPFMAQDLYMIKSVTLGILWPSVTHPSLTFENDTSKMHVVTPNKTTNKSNRFWRESIRQPFIRHRLSFTSRHRYMHNIPSIRTLLEDDILIQISPPLNEPNEHGQSQPIIFRGCSHLSLKNTHLNSIFTSSDVQENAAASMIMQRTRPPKYYKLLSGQPTKAITGVKRSYYESWLRTASVSSDKRNISSGKKDVSDNKKNVFDDVDAMKLLHEFVGNLLHRRVSSQIRA